MIALRDVSVAFGTRTVLDHVSATVPDGGVLRLVGANGVGKSTLLRVVLGLVRPRTGTVTGTRGRRLAAVFQDDRLLEHLTAAGNLRVAVRRRVSDADIRGELAGVGLPPDAASARVCELSGGQRRRVAIARALLADADVVCLDEPFTGIDRASVADLVAHVVARTRGRDVLLVTHDDAEAAPFGVTPLVLEPPVRATL